MRSAKAILLTTLLGASVTAVACNLIDDADKFHARAAGGGPTSGSSSSGTTNTGGTSSGSSSGGCTAASECPPIPAGPCASFGTVTCTSGVCGVSYAAGLAPSQVFGNCRKNLCDSTGKMTSVADDANVYQSGDQCAVFQCADGGSVDTTMAGATCTFKTVPMVVSGVCATNGADVMTCAQCNAATTSGCTGTTTVCLDNVCVAPACGNGTKDNGETDIDCGGAQCIPCGTGKSCTKPTDCLSGMCTGPINNKTCQSATCVDGVQNGGETDIDCGGTNCAACPAGNRCVLPSDCDSKVCMPTDAGPNACEAPTCIDGVQNGTETGIDCGGSCSPCADAG